MKAKDVFISYSQKDSKIVDGILRTLEENNISYYIDKEAIYGSEQVIEILREQIESSQVLLFIGSINSYQSKWAMREVLYAFQEKNGQNILPVIIDQTPLPKNLKFIFTDINIINLQQDSIRKVTKTLLVMLGREQISPFSFSRFIKNWYDNPLNEKDEYLINLYINHFGFPNEIDISDTMLYREHMSFINIPFVFVTPQTSWSINFDWDFIIKLVLSSYTGPDFLTVDYYFKIVSQWIINPQNDPEISLVIRGLNDNYVGKDLEEMEEQEIIQIQETLLKERIDMALRWEYPEHKEYAEQSRKNAIDKLNKEITSIKGLIFQERTKNYDRIGPFVEGRAMVYKGYDIGFINTDGKLITPVQWEDASNFSEGMALVADPDSGNYGFINKDGNVVIPFIFETAHPFKDGKAEVMGRNFNSFYIDRNGDILHDEYIRNENDINS